MIINNSFSAPVTEAAARERAANFLTQAGYKRQLDSGGDIHFIRGSVFGALFNLNPRQWQCVINVSIIPAGNSSEIKIEAIISTDPTEKHFAESLLAAEFELLRNAIILNEIKIYDVNPLKKQIISHLSRIFWIAAALIISATVGVTAASFARVNMGIPMPGAIAIGAGFFLVPGSLFMLILRQKKD